VRVVWLFLAVVGIYWYFGAGEVYLGFSDKPRFHWYSIRADFEVAGKPVSVGGVIECARKAPDLPPFNVHFGRGNPYDPSNEAFAAPLETGGVLMIAPPQTCGHPHASIDVDFPEGYYPLVYWLDDPETPSHMEVYFSDVYYEQPNARVVLKGFEAERLGWRAFSWSSLLGNRQLETLYELVPWFVDREPFWFRGYLTVMAGPDELAEVPGLLDALDNLGSLATISKDDALIVEANRAKKLDEIFHPDSYRNSKVISRYGCRFAKSRSLDRCAAFDRTFGMIPDPDSFGATLREGEPQVGIVTLVPKKNTENPMRDFQFKFFGAVVEHPLRPLLDGTYVFDPRTKSMLETRSLQLGPGRLGIGVRQIGSSL